MTVKPKVMNPILMSRADNSAPDDRRKKGLGTTVDKNAQEIERPDLHPEQIALESNPNLMFEHWDEFWRKIHGPRCSYQDGPDDTFFAGICGYIQVHRLPAGPSCYFAPPYKAMTEPDGSLVKFVGDKIPPYRRPLQDGLVYWLAPTVKDLLPIDTCPKAVNKICPEGNIFVRNGIPSLSAEYVIVPSKTADWAPICTVKTHYVKKDGMGKKELQNYLLHTHADFIKDGELGKRKIERFAYILNMNEKPDEPFYSDDAANLAGISVTFFKNMKDCEEYYGSEEYQKVACKESEILDMEMSEWWTGIVYQVLVPENERATDRMETIEWE